MKIKRRKGGEDERQILTGMIVDRTVLGHVASQWEGDLFQSKWANIIGKWCVEFYSEYQKPPMKDIVSVFRKWSEQTKDENSVDTIDKFLSVLNSEYESQAHEINAAYVVDLASRHFNRIRLKRVADDVADDLDRGNDDVAFDRWTKFQRIDIGTAAGIDLFQDKEAIRQAIESKKDPLIRYPGALGDFFGKSLCRDGFIAFQGPEKRGKSYWLSDIAWMAMMQRRKVAFFEAGDMSQNQIAGRFMERATRSPMFRGPIYYPVDIKKKKLSGHKYETMVRREKRKFSKNLNTGAAIKACDKIMKNKLKSKNSYFKLSCHPSRTLTVGQMRATLQNWERDGWVADVIVIDYVDILAPEYKADFRETVNETWVQLRALSQSFHCLVVTATQSDAASYKVHDIGMEHFSEDKRKLGHVTGLIGINQTQAEKKVDAMRLKWVNERDRNFTKTVHIASCRSISNIAVLSCF